MLVDVLDGPEDPLSDEEMFWTWYDPGPDQQFDPTAPWSGPEAIERQNRQQEAKRERLRAAWREYWWLSRHTIRGFIPY